MTHRWDDFSKSLAEGSVPRRESLRLLGAALAGSVIGPLGLGTARGAAKADPCKSFCRCANKKQQNACLAACKACTSTITRLCGSCGTGFVCKNVANDVRNCGACGNACAPGPYEKAGCVGGRCTYSCVSGAVRCGGTCTLLSSDRDNCGACGNVCGDAGPNGTSACVQGRCVYGCAPGTILCNGQCTAVLWDPNNCGACGNACGGATPYCYQGACTYCSGAMCQGVCTDIYWDSGNCGGCGVVCPEQTACAWGVCEGIAYN